MIKYSFTLILLIFSTISWAQVRFENGYFINNEGKTINCLIKNTGKKKTPSKFKYRLLKDAKTQTASINNVQEYGIPNQFKYTRFVVQVDRSSELLREMSTERKVNFVTDTLFLKSLVEGAFSLYSYQQEGLLRFFYRKGEGEPQQLIFKKYIDQKKRVQLNLEYKQQLWKNIQCDGMKFTDLQRIEYQQKPLVRYFQKYHLCAKQSFTDYTKRNSQNQFYYQLKLGLHNHTVNLKNSRLGAFFDNASDNKIGFRVGIEAEYVFGSNGSKNAVFIEPTLIFANSKQSTNNSLLPGEVVFDYKGLELPLGIRHYFYLSPNNRIFINAGYFFGLAFNSAVTVSPNLTANGDTNFWMNSTDGPFAGLGFSSRGRFSLEIRHGFGQRFHGGLFIWVPRLRKTSLILGINLFRK